MKHGDVILGLLVPAHQQPAEAVQPRMRAFHHPAPRFEARFSLDSGGFFSSWANMGRKAELAQEVAHLVIVIPFVQTHALWVVLGRLWTLDDDALDRRAHEFHIVTVGSLNRQTNGHPMSFREQAAFDSTLASIHGIRAGFFPRPTALWSWPHPSRASPSRFRGSPQTAPVRLATT